MTLSDIIALCGAAAGLVAAYYWYLASKIEARPVWDDDPSLNPKSIEMNNFGWVNALGAAFFHSSNKNATAAKWTAVAVALGAISVVVAKWP